MQSSAEFRGENRFGVAVGSILIVAAVLAIPIVYPAPAVPIALPHITPRATPSADLVGTGCAGFY